MSVLAVADRVAETTDTTGTGTVDLNGAKTGYLGFVAGIGDGKRCYYCIAGGSEWEVGIGTITDAATDTLSRTAVLASSNSGALVNFSSGTKDVFCTGPADLIGYRLGAKHSSYDLDFEADSGISVADGATEGSWINATGSGDDFNESTNPPTYRAADSVDGLPYLEFDGSNDLLEYIRSAGLYTSTDFTGYVVFRGVANGGTNGLLTASESGENMSSGFRWWMQIGTTGLITFTYNSGANSYSGDHQFCGDWTVAAFRFEVFMGLRATLTWIHGGRASVRDAGASSLTALDFDRIRMGCQYNNFGAAGNFSRIDVRAVLARYGADSNEEMSNTLRYLRHKWNADRLLGVSC